MRVLVLIAGLLAAWQGLVWATGVPAFILPGPMRVAAVFADRGALILLHAGTTLAEIALGGFAGCLAGALLAVTLALYRPVRRWLLPVLIASQAIPVFAIAPILVLWLGYGMPAKVATAALVIFFPVTSAFLDGLRRVDQGWLDLARSLDATGGAVLRHIRLPAALPALGSGLRVAAAFAPVGAIIGEWVGSSGGLGYLMLQANGRMQTDLMFAALVTLATLSVVLYYAVDLLVRRLTPWSNEIR